MSKTKHGLLKHPGDLALRVLFAQCSDVRCFFNFISFKKGVGVGLVHQLMQNKSSSRLTRFICRSFIQPRICLSQQCPLPSRFRDHRHFCSWCCLPCCGQDWFRYREDSRRGQSARWRSRRGSRCTQCWGEPTARRCHPRADTTGSLLQSVPTGSRLPPPRPARSRTSVECSRW